ncbi:MAG: SAM-dependent methyltransferase [Frankiaceae bacterium]
MDAGQWDARYTSSELVWGAQPNVFVAAELGGLAPGEALDVACGEGRNSIWLARRGWQAVGVDFSAEAIRRATRLAKEAGVAARVRFAVGDVVADPLPTGSFDAVVVAYLQLPAPQRRATLRKAAARLRPAGTLLVVGHDAANLTDGVGGPQDPAVLFTAQDVVADLADLPGLVVERAEQVRRPVLTPDGQRSAIDALVRVHAAGTDHD